MKNSLKMANVFSRLHHSTGGSAVIEFALLAPVFLFILFGIVEMALVLVVNLFMTNAANSGVEYLRQSAIDRTTITEAGLRTVIANGLPVPTNGDQLKISLIPILNEDLPATALQYPIKNEFTYSSTVGQYLLSVGYSWGVVVPTTKYLIPYSGSTPQLQTTVIAVTATRVTE